MTVTDDNGATATQEVTININGADDDAIANGEFKAALMIGPSYSWGQDQSMNETMFGAFGSSYDVIQNAANNDTSAFSGAYDFVWLDGGNDASWFTTYINNNRTAIEEFVSDGGTVYMNAGRNSNYADLDMGFGATLTNALGDASYSTYSDSGTMTQEGINTIGVGPVDPVVGAYTGDAFTHDAVIDNDGDLTTYMVGVGSGYIGQRGVEFAALSGQEYGDGFAMFGGITEDSYWNPDPDSQILTQNIVSYAASFAEDYALL